MPNQNPLKSQIAANRERFEQTVESEIWHFLKKECPYKRIDRFVPLFKIVESALTTSQTSLLQTAIAAVEGMKIKVSSEDELVKRDGYRDPELQDYEIDVAKSYNEALSKVVELLKGGIE